jgi:hypothetical protein
MAPLAGPYLNMASMGSGEIIITVPYNVEPDSYVNLAVNYKLNDTVGSTYTQSVTVEFYAPDECLNAMIIEPDGFYETFFAFEQDVDITEFYRIGRYTVDKLGCGPMAYQIDDTCRKFISVAEDISTN